MNYHLVYYIQNINESNIKQHFLNNILVSALQFFPLVLISPGIKTAALDDNNFTPCWIGLLRTPSVEIMEAQRTLSDLFVINPGFSTVPLSLLYLLIHLLFDKSVGSIVDNSESVFRLHLTSVCLFKIHSPLNLSSSFFLCEKGSMDI